MFPFLATFLSESKLKLAGPPIGDKCWIPLTNIWLTPSHSSTFSDNFFVEGWWMPWPHVVEKFNRQTFGAKGQSDRPSGLWEVKFDRKVSRLHPQDVPLKIGLRVKWGAITNFGLSSMQNCRKMRGKHFVRENWNNLSGRISCPKGTWREKAVSYQGKWLKRQTSIISFYIKAGSSQNAQAHFSEKSQYETPANSFWSQSNTWFLYFTLTFPPRVRARSITNLCRMHFLSKRNTYNWYA